MILLIALVAGLLVWGGRALITSSAFDVKSVTVKGASHLSADDIRRIAGVAPGDSLTSVSTGEIADKLKAEPWVASATVEKEYPDTVVISVKERRPIAIVDGGGTNLELVSDDLHWLGAPGTESTGTVVIRDVGDFKAVPGKRIEDEEIVNAIKVVAGMSPELMADVRLVSARSVEKTTLITTGEIEIFVGEATRLDEKDEIIRQILEREAGKVVYINVRVVEEPAWRGLSDE